MDYEKRFKEVLAKAQEAITYLPDPVLKKWLESVFPELKDSENERIRKTLIHIVKGACSKYGIKYQEQEISEEKLLAWLEKQKEPEEDFGDFVEKLHSQFPEVSFAKLSRIAVRVKNWLEKQGKEEYALKSSKDEDVRKFMQYIEKEAKAYEFDLPNRGYDIYAFAKDILAWLEKQTQRE